MDIHHEMTIHNTPERVYDALTKIEDLEVWMGHPVAGRLDVGGVLEIHFHRGTMKLEIIRLEPGHLVTWRVIEGVWPMDGLEQFQVITWILEPYEVNTLISFRMEGWPHDDGIYASVSYKWASLMLRLKVHLGDTREIEGFLVRQVV